MKFEVPLMIPAIHSMRFAVRPSRRALMMGMPPATAPSNATITPFFCAAEKISLPWVASSALFAVTTCLPLSIAASTRTFATVVPPISSITISTSGSRTTAKASATTRASPPVSFFAFATSLSATTLMRMSRPARREILQVFHQRPADAPRALPLVGHEVIDIEVQALEGVLADAVHRDAAHRLAVRRDAHARAAREHALHLAFVVCGQRGAQLTVHALGPLQPDRLDDFSGCVGDVDDVHDLSNPSFLNMSLMPRIACRVRASFSISAMRT